MKNPPLSPAAKRAMLAGLAVFTAVSIAATLVFWSAQRELAGTYGQVLAAYFQSFSGTLLPGIETHGFLKQWFLNALVAGLAGTAGAMVYFEKKFKHDDSKEM